METKKFKCKDEVIYRFKGVAGLEDPDPWIYGIFSHYKKDGDIVVNGHCYKECLTDILPYEGNEELVGTDLPADEEVRLEEGEWGFFFDSKEYPFEVGDFQLLRFWFIHKDRFKTSDNNNWNFAIRFSDFNPNDMEETKKHILCVKNGRIIKYKN